MSGVHRDECRVRLLYGRGARPYEDGCHDGVHDYCGTDRLCD